MDTSTEELRQVVGGDAGNAWGLAADVTKRGHDAGPLQPLG
jgi:hypothetical protein